MDLSKYSKPILRISLSLVFLYFGISQITNPSQWAGFVPNFVVSVMPAEKIVMINALTEIVLGGLLLVGLYTRIVSLILSAHLFVIALSIGLNPLGIRDFGLALATLTIFFNGYDRLCLDYKFNEKIYK